MKNLKRQDRNGARHASDIERKYKLGQIDYTAEEIEEMKKKITVDSSLSTSSSNAVANSVITQALNNKVTKETNKGLSSNDFTDELKTKLERLGSSGTEVEYRYYIITTEYSYYIVTTENISTIPITHEQYSEGDLVDVYINGAKLIRDLHFSISENNIVLVNEIDVVGTEIEIVIKKYNQ